MVLFVHIIFFVIANKLAMTHGHTFEVTESDPVPFSKTPLDLVVTG